MFNNFFSIATSSSTFSRSFSEKFQAESARIFFYFIFFNTEQCRSEETGLISAAASETSQRQPTKGR
jgi:hypothetical protein